MAHSITLSAAALDFVALPSAFVESVIALSVAVAAFDILKPIFGKRIWLVVFAFGLFHGFGFASVLGEIGLGKEHLGLSLLGFNVGVEVGQVVVIAVCFPLLFIVRHQRLYHSVVIRYAAFALIAVATIWLTERTLDVELFDPAVQGLKATIKGVLR